MEKTWDNIMSLLVSSNPQAILDLVLPGCRFIKHHRNKLPSSGRQPDAIIEAWRPIDDQFIFNGEFQTYKEKHIPERLLMYNVLLRREHHPLPVRSGVIYLIKNDQIEQPPLCWRMPGNATEKCCGSTMETQRCGRNLQTIFCAWSIQNCLQCCP